MSKTLQVQIWEEVLEAGSLLGTLSTAGAAWPVLRIMAKQLVLQQTAERFALYPGEPGESPDTLDARLLENFMRRTRLGSERELENWLLERNRSREDLRGSLRFGELQKKLEAAVISEETVRQRFVERKARLDCIWFSLLRVRDRETAERLLEDLQRNGSDFYRIVQEYSISPEGRYGGLVGPKSIQELNPEFREHLLGLNPGDYTEPFSLDGSSFLIARLLRLEHATLDEAIKTTLRAELFEEWLERQIALSGVRLIETSHATTSEHTGPVKKRTQSMNGTGAYERGKR